jgi:hypothetical protein
MEQGLQSMDDSTARKSWKEGKMVQESRERVPLAKK